MYTKEQWKHYEKMQDELQGIGHQYLGSFFGSYTISLEHASIDGDSILLECYASCMGYGENESHSIPLHYLWMETEDWIAEEKGRLESIRIAEEKARDQAKVDKRNKEIADEKAKYLELQQKYGGTNDTNH